MLLPADNILFSLIQETGRLPVGEDSGLDGSAAASIAMALNLLNVRENGGVARLHTRAGQLVDALDQIRALLPDDSVQAELVAAADHLARTRQERDVHSIEALWRQTLQALEKLVVAVNRHATLDAGIRTRIAGVLTVWEADELRSQFSAAGATADGEPAEQLTAERWSRYLQQRTDDPALKLTAFRALPGGFGKQTFLFDVEGRALSGSFVIRRDMPDAILSNDCHGIEQEYRLIKAMFDRGFPAPDALWLDTEHPLLPGGHFIVMRRSPGTSGGSYFGAKQDIPADLTQTLADILARLHALPPMEELDGLTESINLKNWQAPLEHCVRDYIESWLAMFEAGEHLPSPGTVSLFSWLLGHIPETRGKPVLLHGDIGFHNFLFDNRQLTAVLDWEFAHLGDPAEDLAYVRNTLGDALDWDVFLAAYQAAGGQPVDERRLHFFQVWGLLRNACAANMAAAKFACGEVKDLKMVLLPHTHIPKYLNDAQALIDAYE